MPAARERRIGARPAASSSAVAKTAGDDGDDRGNGPRHDRVGDFERRQSPIGRGREAVCRDRVIVVSPQQMLDLARARPRCDCSRRFGSFCRHR